MVIALVIYTAKISERKQYEIILNNMFVQQSTRLIMKMMLQRMFQDTNSDSYLRKPTLQYLCMFLHTSFLHLSDKLLMPGIK